MSFLHCLFLEASFLVAILNFHLPSSRHVQQPRSFWHLQEISFLPRRWLWGLLPHHRRPSPSLFCVWIFLLLRYHSWKLLISYHWQNSTFCSGEGFDTATSSSSSESIVLIRFRGGFLLSESESSLEKNKYFEDLWRGTWIPQVLEGTSCLQSHCLSFFSSAQVCLFYSTVFRASWDCCWRVLASLRLDLFGSSLFASPSFSSYFSFFFQISLCAALHS